MISLCGCFCTVWGESQIRRGSNVMAANMVNITTAPKAKAAGPGVIDIKLPDRINATSIATTNKSTMDQRPINSVTRYNLVRVLALNSLLFWMTNDNQINASILPTGTIILAKKITAAIGHEPFCHNSITPPIMVDGLLWPSKVVVMMGYILAGIYMMIAAANNAQVRCRLFGRRVCNGSPQR